MAPEDASDLSRRDFMAACTAASLALAHANGFGVAAGAVVETLVSTTAAALSPASNPQAAAEVVGLLKHVDPKLIYHRRPIDPTKNAWPFWEEAHRHYVGFDPMAIRDPLSRGLDTVLDTNRFPSGKDGRAVRKWLAENGKARHLADQGIATGAIQHPRSPDALKLELLLDQFTVFRNLARVKTVQSAMAAADGNFRAALEQAFGVLAMGKILAGTESLFVDYLVGISITQMGAGAVARVVQNARVCDVELSKCIDRLKAARPDAADLEQVYTVEFCRYFVPYVAEYPVDPDVRTLARFSVYGQSAPDYQPSEVARREANDYIEAVAALLKDHPQPFDKVATIKQASAIQVDSLSKLNQRSAGTEDALYSALQVELRDWPDGVTADPMVLAGLDADPRPPVSSEEITRAREKLTQISNPFGKRLLLDTFGVHYWKSLKLAQARVTAEMLRAAILLYRRRRQRLPESLEELVAEDILGAVPGDPFADQPFQYDSQRSVIWSAGPHGDNHGEINEQGFDSVQTSWRVEPVVPTK